MLADMLFHRGDCPRTEGFHFSVCQDKRGYYLGYVCSQCGTYHRETEFYPSEEAAWADYHMVERGLTISLPRKEDEDGAIRRRLRAAGIDPVAEGEDIPETKKTKILVGNDGLISIDIEDPLGSLLSIRLHMSPWGVILTSHTGFLTVTSNDGFMGYFPASEHQYESTHGLAQTVSDLLADEQEINSVASNIDEESTV